MARNQCILIPEVNGKPSELYKGLLKLTNNRPLTNYIYAAYLANSGVAAKMDSAGYSRDKNGEHKARDVHKVLDVAQFENVGGDVEQIARRIGAKDSRGNTVDFADANQALQIAENLNTSNNKVVASVVQVNDVFNVIVEPITSLTQLKALRTQEQVQTWQLIQQTFNNHGIDLSNLDFARDIVNPLRAKQFVQWLNNNGVTRNAMLTLKDIKMLLTMNENSPTTSTQINRLKSMFGNIDDVAQKIYDAYRARHMGQVVTQNQFILIDSTMTNCKKLNGMDFAGLLDAMDNLQSNLQAGSQIQAIEDTLDSLRKKYKIDNRDIHKASSEIKSLSDAAQEAAFTLQRQLREITSMMGTTPEAKQVEASLNRLNKEIASNRYYAGLLGFLQEALTQMTNMDAMLQATPTGSTNLEIAKNMANTLQRMKNIRAGYYHIVKALSAIDSIVINENITAYDKSVVQNQAQAVRDLFDTNEQLIKDKEKETMKLIAREYLGDSLANGTSINRLVEQAAADSSYYDYLYGIGRVSNPLIATMGTIIREAQDQRTVKLVEMSRRIRRATDKLYKKGMDTEFMYEPDGSGYIISDIDWALFNKARRTAIRDFKKRGYRGLQLKDQIDAWESVHMEDRVVDQTNQRTEKVPNSNYRKAFPYLTPTQEEYYNTMMQIRGEIGSMLPNYAQRHHYIAPQMRRSFIDAMGQAIQDRSLKQAGKAVSNRVKDLFIVREDDTDFASNGIIDGEDYTMASGALDNTPYRQIPLFYLNKVKDQSELLKDFSSGIQALAGTAINFQCMNEIKDMVEFMGDYIKSQNPQARKGDQKQAESIVTNSIAMFKDLIGHTSNSHTQGIVDGFIDKHLYGVKMKDTGKWVKFAQTLLAYTSLRSLAVNVKGAISNYLVGELQMLIEAGGGEFYGLKDYAWAHAKVFGDNTVHGYGRIMDFMTNNRNSEAVLLAERFDPLNEEYGELSHERYHRGPLRHLLGKDFSFIGYGMGEHMIHYVTMYAILNNVKVKIGGKDASLYDAFYVQKPTTPGDRNSELKLKNDVQYKDENGNWVDVDDAFLDKIRNRIRYCNQNTHGSMNEEDKGLIHQHMLGRFAMNLRQWMVEHYSRRYRGTHWDATLGEEREGYYNTVGKFLVELWKDHQKFNFEIKQHWNEMSTQQKANFRRAISEIAILCSLISLSFGLGEPDEHKKDFWMRMWIYQTKRAIVDVNGSQPLGIPMEVTTLLNSPIAATNTVNALMYPFTGLGDLNETVQRGDYAGWNKYGRNMLKYWVPFYNQIYQLQKMDEDDSIFAVFDNTMR